MPTAPRKQTAKWHGARSFGFERTSHQNARQEPETKPGPVFRAVLERRFGVVRSLPEARVRQTGLRLQNKRRSTKVMGLPQRSNRKYGNLSECGSTPVPVRLGTFLVWHRAFPPHVILWETDQGMSDRQGVWLCTCTSHCLILSVDSSCYSASKGR